MPDLFTIPELASKVQADVDTATATLARADATALIEAYTHRSFTAQVEVTERKRINGGKVTLREPVSVVDTVKLVDGTTLLPTVWSFDGIRTLHVDNGRSVIVNLPERDTDLRTVEVTYTHGYTAVPADVKAVGLALAARNYQNPGGLRSENIGNYSYTNAGGDDDVAGQGLLQSERQVLNRYVRQSRTVALG